MMAKASFRLFDYRVRPAKSAERKMMSEAFRRLSFFEPIENYRYVGFGSTTFTDFILFHSSLNISQMVSIEKREGHADRFDFNKPLDCIEIKYGESNEVLPELDWNAHTISWLDYDGKLTRSVLQDVAYISTHSVSGCVLAITINVGGYRINDPTLSDKEVMASRLEKFKKDVGEEKVPGDVKGNNIEGDELARTCQLVFENEIQQVLRNRNGVNPPAKKIKYQRLFNFSYQDGAKMLTLGGIFYEDGDQAIYEKCQFEMLNFINSSDTPFNINIPIMTPRERHYLNARLPQGNKNEATSIGLSEQEIENYSRIYRYCPVFAEIELS